MNNQEQAIWVYMTAESLEEARTIGRALVKERLAACVNILGTIESMYWWQGEIESGAEVALIAKTVHENLTKLTDRVKALHSYDTPCVVSLPMTGGNPDFLQWIREECA